MLFSIVHGLFFAIVEYCTQKRTHLHKWTYTSKEKEGQRACEYCIPFFAFPHSFLTLSRALRERVPECLTELNSTSEWLCLSYSLSHLDVHYESFFSCAPCMDFIWEPILKSITKKKNTNSKRNQKHKLSPANVLHCECSCSVVVDYSEFFFVRCWCVRWFCMMPTVFCWLKWIWMDRGEAWIFTIACTTSICIHYIEHKQ